MSRMVASGRCWDGMEDALDASNFGDGKGC